MTRRARYDPYGASRQPRYVVLRDMQQEVVEWHPLPPWSDLRAGMEAALERLKKAGWTQEGAGDYGFVFLNRSGERRLLTLTPLHPFDEPATNYFPANPHS